jgi:hypothetical protein
LLSAEQVKLGQISTFDIPFSESPDPLADLLRDTAGKMRAKASSGAASTQKRDDSQFLAALDRKRFGNTFSVCILTNIEFYESRETIAEFLFQSA